MTIWDMNITGRRSPFSVVSSGEGNPRGRNDPILSEVMHIFLLDKNQIPLQRRQHHHHSNTIPTRGMHWENQALYWKTVKRKV